MVEVRVLSGVAVVVGVVVGVGVGVEGVVVGTSRVEVVRVGEPVGVGLESVVGGGVGEGVDEDAAGKECQ